VELSGAPVDSTPVGQWVEAGWDSYRRCCLMQRRPSIDEPASGVIHFIVVSDDDSALNPRASIQRLLTYCD